MYFLLGPFFNQTLFYNLLLFSIFFLHEICLNFLRKHLISFVLDLFFADIKKSH